MSKFFTLFFVALISFGLTAQDADARRMGGGSSIGKQRPAPTMKEAAPAKPAQATPTTPSTTTPAAPAPKPSFMSRFGGLIAGLGIGALLASAFGGGLGGLGGFLMMLLVAGIAFVAIRALMSRRAPVAAGPVQFAGAGADPANAPGTRPALDIGGGAAAPAEAPRAAPVAIPGFEAEPFLRVAKTSFIRLQAANDARDLDDIRDFTTPEMFAEIAMQVRDRGDAPQKTEVVTLNASLVEAVVEGDYAIASVRFTGLIREAAEANPEPFDEIWHVRKDQRDRKSTWLIAGIQQVA